MNFYCFILNLGTFSYISYYNRIFATGILHRFIIEHSKITDHVKQSSKHRS
jgi:hypothetical protein